jgi:hexosaminidase
MVFPRMSALSEVLWTQKEKKNWKDFEQRLQTQFKRYDLWKANYSKAYYDVKVSLLPTTNYQGITVKVEPVDKKGVIRFATDNNAILTAYTKPLVIDKSTNVVLNYYRNDQLVNNIPLSLSFNKATGRKVSISTPPQPKYPGQGGAFSLVNGVWSNKGLSHPDWLGWIGDDMEATIDLGKSTVIDSVRMHTLDQKPSGVYLPQYVEVYASSDGKDFTSIGKSSTYIKDTLTMGWMVIPVDKKQARYVKIHAKNFGLVPENQPFAGTKAWLFADEIQVY